MSNSQRKKQSAAQFNEAYEKEQLRWNAMTRDEQVHEIVKKSVNSAWAGLKPQLDNFLGNTK